MQPIDPRAVAGAVADAVETGPARGEREIAGPEIRSVTELARVWMGATGRRRLLAPVPAFGAMGRSLRRGALTAPDAATPTATFATWLRER